MRAGQKNAGPSPLNSLKLSSFYGFALSLFPGNGFKGPVHAFFAPSFRLCGGFYRIVPSVVLHRCQSPPGSCPHDPARFQDRLLFRSAGVYMFHKPAHELVVMLAPEPGSANPDHPQRGLDLEIHFSTSIKKVRHDRDGTRRLAVSILCGMIFPHHLHRDETQQWKHRYSHQSRNHAAIMETNFKTGLGTGVDPILNVDPRVFCQHTRQTVLL